MAMIITMLTLFMSMMIIPSTITKKLELNSNMFVIEFYLFDSGQCWKYDQA